MIANILINMELWSGFFGTLVGALIGGLIAYFIAKYQFNIQDKKNQQRDQREKERQQIQLLWQIYLDKKKECEISNLWEKFDELLQKRERLIGSPSAEYTHETLQYIMRDIKNLLNLLKAKENDIISDDYIEIDLLWDRIGQLLIFMVTIYKKLVEFTKISTTQIMTYYNEANDLIQEHKNRVQKRK